MVTRLGRGHCGAHLTLLFTVEDRSSELESQGSTGAGICLEDGVEAIARGEEGGSSLAVTFQGNKHDSEMYQEVLDELCSEIPEAGELEWELTIMMDLPTSQGFGMSASGAIAAAMSFQRALGIPNEECLRRSFLIAHRVERKRSSGLGDTTALAAGGVERRVVAGSPYSGPLLEIGPGRSHGWSQGTPVLVCWKEETGTPTSRYIDNTRWKERITSAGIEQMSVIGRGEWGPERWSELIECAKSFVEESGLLDDASRSDLLASVNKEISNSDFDGDVTALLCMLGESVVVVPTDANNDEGDLGALSVFLEGSGLATMLSRVGGLP